LINLAFLYRIYPSPEQEIMLSKTFGCSRFIYNSIKSDYEQQPKGERKYKTPAYFKEEKEWLKEVDSLALCNEQLHIRAAFKRFYEQTLPKLSKLKNIAKKYKKSAVKKYNKDNTYQFQISDYKGYPNFHSRKSDRQSYTTNNVNGNIRIVKGGLRLPKIGIIKTVFHRYCPGTIKSVTVSKNASGEYYVSILVVLPDVEIKEVKEEKVLGGDTSFHELMVYSDGTRAKYPKFYNKSLTKQKREQRWLSKKEKGSKNYEKQRIKLAKIKNHVKNQRKDFQYNEVKRILNAGYTTVVVEDMDMQSMANKKCKHGKSVYDIACGQFRNILEYKLKEIGGKLIKVDRFFPSTQLCHVCGYKNTALKDLSIRKWTCPNCGNFHDRDINAAINLKQYYMYHCNDGNITNACGEGVRPVWQSSIRDNLSPEKQEKLSCKTWQAPCFSEG